MGNNLLVESIVKAVLKELETEGSGRCCSGSGKPGIPTGVSNRHVHLSQNHMDILFGKGKAFHKLRDLSQPGQCVYEEVVTLVGTGGSIDKVRILGPARMQTQVELLVGDFARLGVNAPVRESGKLEGSAGGITLVGPVGCVRIDEGVIVSQRHIHMHTSDAVKFNIEDGKTVSVKVDTPRGGILGGTAVRVSESFRLEFHIDFDEANAMMLKPGDLVTICGMDGKY